MSFFDVPDGEGELIEIRCLWQRTDYGYITLAAAARGYGGRQLGSYQDAITNRRFAALRAHEREVNPDWPLVEAVVKVPAASVEALFTDGTEIPVVPEPARHEEREAASASEEGKAEEERGDSYRALTIQGIRVFAGPGCAECRQRGYYMGGGGGPLSCPYCGPGGRGKRS